MIRIRSKRHNFRRCGMPHPKGPVDYPDDRFSEEELAILQAETMLIVEVIETRTCPPSGRRDSKLEPARHPAGGTGITEIEESESEEVAEERKTEEISIDDITVAQIKDELDTKGIKYSDKALKAELFELYQATKVSSE